MTPVIDNLITTEILGRRAEFYDVRDHRGRRFEPSPSLHDEMLALAEHRPDRTTPAVDYVRSLHIRCFCGGRCGGYAACVYGSPRDVLDSEALSRWVQNSAGGQFAAATFANSQIDPQFDVIVEIGAGAGNSLEAMLKVAHADRIVAVEPAAPHRRFLADAAPDLELVENVNAIAPDRSKRALVVLVGVLNCADRSLAEDAARMIAGFGSAIVVHLQHDRRPSANDSRFTDALARAFGGKDNIILAGFDWWERRYSATIWEVGDSVAA